MERRAKPFKPTGGSRRRTTEVWLIWPVYITFRLIAFSALDERDRQGQLDPLLILVPAAVAVAET